MCQLSVGAVLLLAVTSVLSQTYIPYYPQRGYYRNYPVSYYSNPYTRYPYYAYQNYRVADNNVYVTDKYGQTIVKPAYDYYKESLRSVCESGTCGTNAFCKVVADRPVCSCMRGYMGDPSVFCKRAECLDHLECRGHQACKEGVCVNPCQGVCGQNANCEVRNHVPVCSCPVGYTGDPFSLCRRFNPAELCSPSPCGQNTVCEVVNNVATCKCASGYHGNPAIGCKHECDSDYECGLHMSCVDFRCQNPCKLQCGQNAECEGVRNHVAICKCPRGYYGNPLVSCQPECTTDSECPGTKPACINNSCKNPCDGVCGLGANCELRGVTPVCSCPKGTTGNPFISCRLIEHVDVCAPNPCGLNANCEPGFDKYKTERPVCTCPAGYKGDPFSQCIKGECTDNEHCADHQACINFQCQNPCIGQCGINAECSAKRHIAVCTCPPAHTGDALIRCQPVSSSIISYRYF